MTENGFQTKIRLLDRQLSNGVANELKFFLVSPKIQKRNSHCCMDHEEKSFPTIIFLSAYLVFSICVFLDSDIRDNSRIDSWY